MNGCSSFSSANMYVPPARRMSQKHGMASRIGRLCRLLNCLQNASFLVGDDSTSAGTLFIRMPVFLSNKS